MMCNVWCTPQAVLSFGTTPNRALQTTCWAQPGSAKVPGQPWIRAALRLRAKRWETLLKAVLVSRGIGSSTPTLKENSTVSVSPSAKPMQVKQAPRQMQCSACILSAFEYSEIVCGACTCACSNYFWATNTQGGPYAAVDYTEKNKRFEHSMSRMMPKLPNSYSPRPQQPSFGVKAARSLWRGRPSCPRCCIMACTTLSAVITSGTMTTAP